MRRTFCEIYYFHFPPPDGALYFKQIMFKRNSVIQPVRRYISRGDGAIKYEFYGNFLKLLLETLITTTHKSSARA